MACAAVICVWDVTVICVWDVTVCGGDMTGTDVRVPLIYGVSSYRRG